MKRIENIFDLNMEKIENIIVGAQENSFYIYLNIKENNSLRNILQPIFPQLKFHLSL